MEGEDEEEEKEKENEENLMFRVLSPHFPPLLLLTPPHKRSGDALPSELQGVPTELFLARSSHTVGRIAAPGAAADGVGEGGKGTVPVKVRGSGERREGWGR